jgi:hypothetical protein
VAGLTLLARAREAGLEVQLDGETLVVRGPQRLATLAQEVLAAKAEIVLLLRGESEHLTMEKIRDIFDDPDAAQRARIVVASQPHVWPPDGCHVVSSVAPKLLARAGVDSVPADFSEEMDHLLRQAVTAGLTMYVLGDKSLHVYGPATQQELADALAARAAEVVFAVRQAQQALTGHTPGPEQSYALTPLSDWFACPSTPDVPRIVEPITTEATSVLDLARVQGFPRLPFKAATAVVGTEAGWRRFVTTVSREDLVLARDQLRATLQGAGV